ncbi:MAG: hypothetical protein H0T93_12670, partial [Chloroflexia bacterium]|nr:hypothetical protein [Chloroflexia bacterium]
MFRFPRSNRQPMLALIAAFTMLLALLMPAAGAPGSYGDPAPSTSIASPDVTAQSVFSFDLASGITLYEKNPDERMQIGSTVKVATALVVMQHGDPADQVLI